MKHIWKRSIFALAAALTLGLSASAQDLKIQASFGGKLGKIAASFGTQSPGGYYKNVRTKVWVPGAVQKQWIPARYGWIWDCGVKRWGLIQKGYYHQSQGQGHYVWQTQRVWVSNKVYGGSSKRRYSRGRSVTRRY